MILQLFWLVPALIFFTVLFVGTETLDQCLPAPWYTV